MRNPGKKLDQYPAPEEEVLLLMERVSEAKRISQVVLAIMPHSSAFFHRLSSRISYLCHCRLSVWCPCGIRQADT